jgi:hypothetical protein
MNGVITSLRADVAVRLVLLAFGALGIAWSAAVVDGLSGTLQVRELANRILNGEKVPLPALPLSYLDQKYAAECSNDSIVAAAIIRLYAATSAQGSADGPKRLGEAREGIRNALACSPLQPFLWYSLFWVERTRGAPVDYFVKLLEFSYEIGPREAWISFYRSRDAISQYNRLSLSAQQRVRDEYRTVVREQSEVAAAIFRDADLFMQPRLMSWIEDLPLEARQRLAAALDRLDLVANIPGVEYRDGKVFVPRRTEE